jgi:hypothetical protein
MFRIGPAALPEAFAIQVKSGNARDLLSGALDEENVGVPVSAEVAEPRYHPTEIFQIDLPDTLGPACRLAVNADHRTEQNTDQQT